VFSIKETPSMASNRVKDSDTDRKGGSSLFGFDTLLATPFRSTTIISQSKQQTG